MKDNTKKQLIEDIESLRKRVAELELEKTARERVEEDWRNSFNSLEDVVLIVDNDYNIENMNDEGLALLKKSRDEVIGRKCYKVIAGVDSLPEYCPCREASRTKKAASIDRYERRLGRYFSIKSSPIVDENGEIMKFVDLRRDITERKWLEKELRQSEQKYRAFLDDWGDVTYEADLQGNMTYANKAAERITAIPLEDIVGKSFLSLFAEESQETALDVYRRTLKGKKPEYELTLRNGKILHFRNKPLRNKYGKIVGLFGIARDITQRKKAEEALRESEERLRSLLENIPDFVITVDHNHKILMINRGIPGIITVEQAIGTEVYNYVEPAHHEIMRESLEKVFQTGMPERYEVLGTGPEGPDTAWYETRVSPNKLDGQVISVTLISSDITKRKQAEEELVRLSSAVKMSTDSIVISDLDGKIIDVNEATLKMYGTDDKRDLIGKDSFELIAPEEREKALAGTKEVLEKGYVKSREYHIITKGGGRVPVEMSVAIMKEADGKPIGFVAVSRDITERKQAEEELESGKKKLESYIESMVDGVVLSDLEGTTVDINKACLELLGYKRKEDVVGRPGFIRTILKKDMPKIGALLEEIIKKGCVRDKEITVLAQDRREIPILFSATLIKDAEGKPTSIFTIFKDITEQKKAEEELEFRAELLNGATDSILVSDLDGNLLYVNEEACRSRGYSKEEMLGMNINQLAVSKYAKLIKSRIQELMQKGEIKIDNAHYRKDGSVIPLEAYIRVIEVGGKKLLMSVARDITERKKAEEKIEHLNFVIHGCDAREASM